LPCTPAEGEVEHEHGVGAGQARLEQVAVAQVTVDDPALGGNQPILHARPFGLRGGLQIRLPEVLVEFDDRQPGDRADAARRGRLAGPAPSEDHHPLHAHSMPGSMAAVAERVGGRAPAATDSTIADGDWVGADLTGDVHEQVLFQDAEFSEATADGAQFTDCTFRSAQFVGAQFTNVAFENCTFVRCSFVNAQFMGCKFIGSTFDGCEFAQTRVEGGNWSFVGLPGADLRRASFADVRMREADLTGARCAGGALRNCDLAGAMWSRADVRRCDLRGSDVSSLDPFGVEIRGAIIDWNQAVALAHNLGLDIRAD
jgi:hypothetical protein